AALGSPRSPAAPVAAAGGAEDKIRVLLVDDHAIVRQGLREILAAEPDMAVVAEASDGEQAVDQARAHRPDVVVMDVSMPGVNGIDATKAIMAEVPETKIVGLSLYVADDQAEAMRAAGAVGYVNKGEHSTVLLAAIRAAVGVASKS
ncbi:MAG: response regulator transcription factor, partial [Candidatus Krumholzibacteriia bacterium]